MVPLARPPSPPSHRELVCSVLTSCVPLREMLALLLARRRLYHRSFTTLSELLAQTDQLARRGDDFRFVVLVGPGLDPDAVARLDAALARLAGPVDLVVFDDALDGEPLSFVDTAVRPRMRSPVPPRLFEVLRVIDGRAS